MSLIDLSEAKSYKKPEEPAVAPDVEFHAVVAGHKGAQPINFKLRSDTVLTDLGGGSWKAHETVVGKRFLENSGDKTEFEVVGIGRWTGEQKAHKPLVPPVPKLTDIQSAVVSLKEAARGLIDVKFALLKKFGSMPAIPGLVGVQDPRGEIVGKMKHIDNNMVKITDLLLAADIVMVHYVRVENPHFRPHDHPVDLRQYPQMLESVDEVAKTIMKTVNEPEGEVDNEAKMLVYGFAELHRKHHLLGL